MKHKDRHKYHPLKNPQVAAIKWLNESRFRPDLTFNLTFKDNPWEEDGYNYFDKEKTYNQFTGIHNKFKRFMGDINRIYFGRKWHGKYVKDKKSVTQAFATIEVKNGRPHIHGAIEVPYHSDKVPDVTRGHLTKMIENSWHYSNFVFDFENIWNADGWHDYITKDFDWTACLGVVEYSNFSY